MLHRFERHATAIVCGTVLLLSCAVLPIAAQSTAPASGKKPISYDVYDAWWSIQGTTLARDGDWLAYALTAQALDGQLVVRNLRTGQEFKHPRGTNPSFTPDGKFLAFSIVPTKAEDERKSRPIVRAVAAKVRDAKDRRRAAAAVSGLSPGTLPAS
jgi:hypothetical protein